MCFLELGETCLVSAQIAGGSVKKSMVACHMTEAVREARLPQFSGKGNAILFAEASVSQFRSHTFIPLKRKGGCRVVLRALRGLNVAESSCFCKASGSESKHRRSSG